MEHNEVEESHLVGGKLVGYFASAAEDLNSGLPSTNLDSGQGGTWALTAQPLCLLLSG